MRPEEIYSGLLALFDGRRDCYFSSDQTALVWSDEDEWESAFALHAAGRVDIGVYPRRDSGKCRWGCVDIDSGDFSEALEVFGVLSDAGIESWIETSGSWKDLTKPGYHVWVFASDWIEGHTMRSILVEAARTAKLPDNVEINPKQITATRKGVGNCVRLPYGRRSRVHPGYSTMSFSPGGEYRTFSVEEFLSEVTPTPTRDLKVVGAAAQKGQRRREAVTEAIEALRRHEYAVPVFGTGGGGGRNQRAWRLLKGLERAEEGERNICAFVMACHLRGSHKTLEAAKAEMAVAVRRGFADGENFVDEALGIVDRIYKEER